MLERISQGMEERCARISAKDIANEPARSVVDWRFMREAQLQLMMREATDWIQQLGSVDMSFQSQKGFPPKKGGTSC